MRNINLPDNSNSMVDLEKALTYKDGTLKYELKQKEKKIISEFYQKYDDLLGEPHDDFKSSSLLKKTNKALYNAYSEIQINGRLSNLRDNLLLSANRCPYCGILPADELDHYLPRSIFKGISVYCRNLIPICNKCNNSKRTASGVNNSFFHAYFEKLPAIPVFVCETNFNNNMLVINYKVDKKHIKPDLGNKLDFQFTRTKLNNRLIKESNDYLFDLKASIELMYDSDNDNGVKKLLLKNHTDQSTKFGINFWKTAFLLSLSKCDDFCKGGFIEHFKKK